MTEIKPPYKFEIETAPGTFKDISAFVSSAEIKPVEKKASVFIRLMPKCDICGADSVCVVVTSTNDDKAWEFTDKTAQSVVYYCKEHEPASR